MDNDRMDLTVALLARLNIDVACMLFARGGDLDVVTREDLQRHPGSENQYVADRYRAMMTAGRPALVGLA